MNGSKLYIFNSPPRVELDMQSYFGPCDWGGYVWDRKKWEPQVEQELRIDWVKHHQYIMEHQKRLHELAIEDFRDNVAGRGKWAR
jgi:hypothetical protein